MQSTGAGKTIAQLLTGHLLASRGVEVFYAAPPVALGAFLNDIGGLAGESETLASLPVGGLRNFITMLNSYI
mgnify:FL=1